MKKFDDFVEDYCADAEAGKDADWAEWDPGESAWLLVRLYALLRSKLPREDPIRVVLEAREMIEDYVLKYAEHRAEKIMEDCTCRTPPVRYDSISPPEPVRNRDCPVHGCGEDYRRER